MTLTRILIVIMLIPLFHSFQYSVSTIGVGRFFKQQISSKRILNNRITKSMALIMRQKKGINSDDESFINNNLQNSGGYSETDWIKEGYFDEQKQNIYDIFSKSKEDKIEKKGKGNGNIKMKSLAPEYKPRGENQKLYFKYLNDPTIPIVLGYGPAGSGKTLFACYTAVKELKAENVQKIIMTRPLVSVDKEDIGFLPGDLERKMDPWTRPMFDILLEFFSQRDIDVMIDSGVIEISPLAYMRGRTFKKCFIIADEMQNSSPNQMLMLTTRIGNGTKMVITGDLKQSDRMQENGLLDFITKIKKNGNSCNEIKCVEMEAGDIERSPIVSKILEMYEEPKKIDNLVISNKVVVENVTNIIPIVTVNETLNTAVNDKLYSNIILNSTRKSSLGVKRLFNENNKYGSDCGW